MFKQSCGKGWVWLQCEAGSSLGITGISHNPNSPANFVPVIKDLKVAVPSIDTRRVRERHMMIGRNVRELKGETHGVSAVG